MALELVKQLSHTGGFDGEVRKVVFVLLSMHRGCLSESPADFV